MLILRFSGAFDLRLCLGKIGKSKNRFLDLINQLLFKLPH